jgi:D-alanine transaminase
MTRTPLANVNGRIMPLSEAVVPALDRGFLFGDAVYEVLRIHGGQPWLLDEHWRRLQRSLAEIRIVGVDLARLRQRMLDTIAAGPFSDAVTYIQITRGVPERRIHAWQEGATPFEILWVEPYVDRLGEARRDGVKVITQPDIRWGRCDVKSTNLLANVLASQAAWEAGAAEVLLVHPDDVITEASRSSLFGILDGRLRTTPTGPSILPGVTRDFVLGLARDLGLTLLEESLHRPDLVRVTELFLTGTTYEVLPIVRVDDQTIADGRPGPITLQLQERYRQSWRSHA